MISNLKAPFPWYGGKSRVADLVWKRFGNVRNYVEPFFGSGAILLARPHAPRVETINDKDCYVANFWRAVSNDPEKTAKFADWPVNEADLHARHLWLVKQTTFREKMRTDPDFYDPKIAGWWVWGQSMWVGRGWCVTESEAHNNRPQTRPHLSRSGQGTQRTSISDLSIYFERLKSRLERVRVVCGDWKRVVGPSLAAWEESAIFLDPPYTEASGRSKGIYSTDSLSVGTEVFQWCVENGNNPKFKIALCGYEGEYDIPVSWETVRWDAAGGYATISKKATARDNGKKERIWFSPHCLKPTLF